MSNLIKKKLQKKVRAIITNQKGEFLLIQPHSYKDHQWTFVGGGVEEGESIEQAMRRELKEEVGIDRILSLEISSMKTSYEFSQKFKDIKKTEYDGQIASLFLIQVSDDIQIKLQVEEVKSFCWASLEEVRKLVTVPKQLEWFNFVIDELFESKAA